MYATIEVLKRGVETLKPIHIEQIERELLTRVRRIIRHQRDVINHNLTAIGDIRPSLKVLPKHVLDNYVLQRIYRATARLALQVEPPIIALIKRDILKYELTSNQTP